MKTYCLLLTILNSFAQASAECVSLSQGTSTDPVKICYTDREASLTDAHQNKIDVFAIEYKSQTVPFRGSTLYWVFKTWKGESPNYRFEAEVQNLSTSTRLHLSLLNLHENAYQFGQFDTSFAPPPFHDAHGGGYGNSH